MYIGGFEGSSSLAADALDSLVIHDNNPFNIPLISNVSLNQIHFPRLVEISGLDIFLINNPDLCYIGELEYYKASSNQTVRYSTLQGIPRKNYSDCGMFCEKLLIILFNFHVKIIWLYLSRKYHLNINMYSYVNIFRYNYHIEQNFDQGNIGGLTSIRSLTGKILMDSLLDNLYLLYN